MLDPLDCLAATIEATAKGAPLPPEAAAWLRSGLTRYTRTGDALEICLSLGSFARMKARDRALLEAADALDPDRELDTWKRAEMLRKAVVRFEDRVMPRLLNGAARELTPSEEALQRAFAAGAPRMVRSRRRLYDLLLTN